MTKKDLVEAAVAFYLDSRREEMQAGMRELLGTLDGSRAARIAMLAGMTREELDSVGGVEERRLTMAGLARPTLRCLREDLALVVPRAPTPRLRKSAIRSWPGPPSASPTTRRRTNGSPLLTMRCCSRSKPSAGEAPWIDAGIPWVVAAGWREERSPDDFYASLAARGKTARARYNAEHSPPLGTRPGRPGFPPSCGADVRKRPLVAGGKRGHDVHPLGGRWSLTNVHT